MKQPRPIAPTEPVDGGYHRYVVGENEASPQLHYTDSGPQDAPLTVLLLHSLGADHRLWEPQRRKLCSEYRVLAADARGHGHSQWHSPVGTNEWCHDIERILDHAGVAHAVVVGLSMGGVQALAFAQAHPNRVSGLVIADSFAELDPATARAKVDGLVGEAERVGMATLAESYIATTFTTDAYPAGAEDVRAAIATTLFAAYAASARACFTARLNAGLSDITATTTVLWGERDTKTPRSLSEELCRDIAGANFTVLPAAGHLSNLENPDAFTAAVRTLLASVTDSDHVQTAHCQPNWR